MLRSGQWPSINPSSYTDWASVSDRANPHAPFETAVMVALEAQLRAAKCGLDGYLVEEKYIVGLTEEEIARKRHMEVWDVERRINKVLWYCASGRNQRKETYEEWKKLRKYRRRADGVAAVQR